MKRIAYSFLLFFVLSPACGFAQGGFRFALVAEGFLGTAVNVPAVGNSPSYLTSPPVLAGLGSIEMGYYNWDRFCLSAQILINLPDPSYLQIPILIRIPVIKNDWKGYVFAGPLAGIGTANESGGIDFAIYFGIGILNYLNKDADYFFQLGFSLGIFDISGPSSIDPTADYIRYRIYTRELHLQFGILFGK